jgi:DNA-binding NarL/FixJ family response regulator
MLRIVTGARLVFLTVNEDPDIAAEAIRLGESGYLLKRLRVGRANSSRRAAR